MYQVFYLPSFLERSRIGALPIDFQHSGKVSSREFATWTSRSTQHTSTEQPLRRDRMPRRERRIRVERRNLECGVISWYYY